MNLGFKKYSALGYLCLSGLLLLICRLVMETFLQEKTGFDAPWLGMFADLFIPSLLLAGAMMVKWKYWGYAIAAVVGVLILFNIINIVLVSKYVSVFTYELFRIFHESGDDEGLNSFVGIWVHAPFVSVVVWLGVSFWGGERIQDALESAWRDRAVRRRSGYVAGLLVIFSLLANMGYYSYWGKTARNSQREWLLRPAVSYIAEYFRDFREYRYWRSVKAPKGYYPGRFDVAEHALLQSLGLERGRGNSATIGAVEPFEKIIIVAVESLDLRFLSAFDKDIPVESTRELNALADKYLAFKNFFTAAQPTSRGTHAILCSRMNYIRDLNCEIDSLFGVMEKAGYQTRMLNGFIGSFELANRRYKDVFKPMKSYFYEDFAELYGQKSGIWGISDHQLFINAFDLMNREQPGRFIFYLATLDTHLPYRNSGPYKEEAERLFSSKLLQSIYCLDKNLGEFVRNIQSAPWYDQKTLIVITADHSATHGDNYHQRASFDPDRIPLILISKDNVLGAYFDPERYSSQIDLAPTLLKLSGLDVPDSFMGSGLDKAADGALIKVENGLQYRTSLEDEIIDIEKPESWCGETISRFYRQFYPAQSSDK